VWSDVPEAIFVNAHAASNCIKDKDKFQLNTTTMHEMCIDQIREDISRLITHWCQGMRLMSTCSWGKSARRRKPTNWGTTSAAITSSIGGLRSARQIHKMAQQCMHHNLKTCDSYINIQKEQWNKSYLWKVASEIESWLLVVWPDPQSTPLLPWPGRSPTAAVTNPDKQIRDMMAIYARDSSCRYRKTTPVP
jgi:hypothetical protein